MKQQVGFSKKWVLRWVSIDNESFPDSNLHNLDQSNLAGTEHVRFFMQDLKLKTNCESDFSAEFQVSKHFDHLIISMHMSAHNQEGKKKSKNWTGSVQRFFPSN